jgi:hypothetical protein
VIVDASTGKELHSYFVRGFAWKPSPGGAHVAYDYYGRPRFCIDDECRFDGSGGYRGPDRHLEFQWEPVWSDDGTQVAIIAEDIARDRKKVVIVKRVDGTVDEFAVPPEAGDHVVLSWDGPGLLVRSVRSERLRWKVSADRSGLVRILK